ncbi:AP2-like DNA-binding integrase domain-containing protein [Halolactibacillus halophilus]|uniref:AP2-like DNA-binding integrase domain-containing protein n=1 Tax=Halolactibacillus halophilus TaxID=306540 RepID=A0A1I5Q1D9_9BACI|nr:tyrosine-type recombinase/integrase [Halolactibacillus halophilus]GEM01939.1 site-specific integrase [Halolactibacillus halophilus]SFP40027.1 AP2-like DNA-binding integrase domain-containing protein [Halolactibacillus halophilus]
MKLHKTRKDSELYYYYTKSNEKRWLYRHNYKDTNGKWKEKKKQGFKSEKEAYRSLLEIKAKTVNGQSREVKNSNLTVSQWFDMWYESHKSDWKVTSANQREMVIRLTIKPLLGHYKLQELDRTTYKRVFINELRKRYSPSTAKMHHIIFKIGINSAVEDEILHRNRFNKIPMEDKNLKADRLKGNFYNAEELNLLLDDAKKNENETVYTTLYVLGYTGLRRGELLGLHWNDIDFENRTLTVKRTRDKDGVRSPKTNNSYRTIPIDDQLTDHLRNYKTWCKKLKLSFGQKLKENDYVILSYQTCKPFAENSLFYGLRRCYERTGLHHVTIHGLRHTHATILMNKGVNVKYVAERLGNTPAMILDIYGHTYKTLERDVANTFSDTMNGVSGGFSGGLKKSTL